MQSLMDICSLITSCKKCDLYFSRKKAVCGYGTDKPKLVIIGEAPGAKEDEVGRPFVGRSGNLLNKALNYAGILPKDIYITNSVRCRPKIGKSPKITEIKSCSDYLKEELRILKPLMLVPMGNSAIRSLNVILGTKLGRISELEGTVIFLDEKLIAPQYHPAAILRNPKKMEQFKDNFVKIAEILKNLDNGFSDSLLSNYKIKKINASSSY